MSEHRYPDADRAAVYRVIAERRDMRHFAGGEVDRATLQRLLAAAHRAPSVGLMQPWRFCRITDPGLRAAIGDLVRDETELTAEALGDRGAEFSRLKVEGIAECAELLVVALTEDRERHVFGRRTMPHMDLASASCAIQNLWLAARTEGLGMGWVSLFDPERLGMLLGFPPGAEPIAVLCLGPVDEFYARPMLEETGWTTAQPLEELLAENGWPGGGAPTATPSA
ncbi:5,6-dimethylbenzimidazole synthase [Aeromicrobium piscarium]|uniref:5,6-dimethylbenzimidazole synthase n=1 Tax=Aeromicrobium piscarium TaxID=2590901 RepID=A0A554SFJ4_9ACTN|nr:5,6-dimethylbenzimidazole synthase [Aeromicrobium piscarium]TSD65125.1 5,6-dimethylbenzimidazole synthase [Aeromicrobium piscarium]